MRYDLNEYVAVIPDFPKKGVSFKSVNPLLRYKFQETVQALLDIIPAEELAEVDAFVGLEARGFPFAAAMAARTGKGFVMARKKGKLAQPAASISYGLEYGSADIEMESGEGNVIIIDDVLATGGTLAAAADLSEQVGYKVKGLVTLVNLRFLNNFDWKGMKCRAVLDYDADGNMLEPEYVKASVPALN